MRRAVNKGRSVRKFNGQARKTHKRNVKAPPRGGFRL